MLGSESSGRSNRTEMFWSELGLDELSTLKRTASFPLLQSYCPDVLSRYCGYRLHAKQDCELKIRSSH